MFWKKKVAALTDEQFLFRRLPPPMRAAIST
jgi:hypothetical protein